MNKELKDWQIAREMFGKNTKQECTKVMNLRRNGVIEPICDGWSRITDKRLEDDCGYVISNELL